MSSSALPWPRNRWTFLLIFTVSMARAQNPSVYCGAGTYLINQKHIDIYLLPNTYITLQPFLRPLANSNITWFAAVNKTDLLMSSSRQLGENLNIGPMTMKLHHMRVMYVAHYKQQGNSVQYVSQSATLRLSAANLDVHTKRVYTVDDHVEVSASYIGQTRPVCCYKLSLPETMAQRDIPRIHHLLYKMQGKIRKAVKSTRYNYQNGCLQINGIREADMGKYMLLLKTCLSKTSVSVIYFSLRIVAPSSNLPTIMQSSPSPTTEERSSRSTRPKAQTTAFPTTNRITTSTELVYNPSKTTPMAMATRVTVQVSQIATATLSTGNDSMVTNATTPPSTRNEMLTRQTVESWVVVTIAAFVFILLIVIVFLSYKHRQTLLTFCFSSCRRIKTRRRQTNASHWHDDYDTKFYDFNVGREEITTGTFRRRTSEEHLDAESPIDQSHTVEHTSHTLPDIITEAAAQKPIDATSDKIDGDVQPTESVNKEIHEMPIYACVNKKKSVRAPQENIKPTPSVAVPHSSAYVPICIPPSPKVNILPTTENAPEDIRVKDTNSNTSLIDGTQNKPQRPVPFDLYKSKKEKSEKDDSKKLEEQDLQTKQDAKKDSHQDTAQRSDQITAKDTSQKPSQEPRQIAEKDTDQDSAVLYAQLIKPKPKEDDATEKADSRSKHGIQYVELDLSALNKKL